MCGVGGEAEERLGGRNSHGPLVLFHKVFPHKDPWKAAVSGQLGLP